MVQTWRTIGLRRKVRRGLPSSDIGPGVWKGDRNPTKVGPLASERLRRGQRSRLKNPLHTRGKSRDHEIVRAQRKVARGRPNIPSKLCSVVTIDHELVPRKMPCYVVRVHGLHFMIRVLENLIYKAVGPLTRCKLNVDQKE